MCKDPIGYDINNHMKKLSIIFIALVALMMGCTKSQQERTNSEVQKEEATDIVEKSITSNGDWPILDMEKHPILKENLARLLRSIAEGDKQYVVDHILYPIRIGEGYPLDSVRNKRDMLKLYDKVFDDSLITVMKRHQKLSEYEWSPDEINDWHCTLERGEYIWFSMDDQDNCYIRSINYVSAWEQEERKRLLEEEISSLHESLRTKGIDNCHRQLPFIVQQDKHTTWFCRIDEGCGDSIFDYHGKKYPSRIAIYLNHIGYRQKPDFVYYGQYDYSARNWWYTFYDQDENIRAIFEYRAVVGEGEESGYYFSINEDEESIKCKTFSWLDWLKRHK